MKGITLNMHVIPLLFLSTHYQDNSSAVIERTNHIVVFCKVLFS